MNPDVQRLICQSLALAQTAPSADNSQPWEPKVVCSTDSTLIQLTLSLKLKASFPKTSDYLNRFSTLSLGAFAYTFAQGVGAEGYELKDIVEGAAGFKFYFRKTADTHPVFLPEICRARRTDRSLWRNCPLNPRQKNEIIGLFKDSDTALFISPSRQRLGALYHLFASDLVRFLNPIPRKYFYSTLRFGVENEHHEGLDPRAFGLSKPEQAFIKLLRDHSLLQTPLTLLSALPMSLIGSGLRWYYSSAIVILSEKEDTPLAWVNLGMSLQKLWLYCSQEKIGLQPIASTFLAYQYLKIPDKQKIFSPLQQFILRGTSTYFSQNNMLNCARPHLCVRIGYPDPKTLLPPASLRQTLTPSFHADPNLH